MPADLSPHYGGPAGEPPLLAVRNMSKTFGSRTVLNAVDLEVMPGEVHCLLGQNGSGKSTLIKILSAYHRPDPGGWMAVRGQEVRLPLRPSDPALLGLSFVHQDLGLLEQGTVVENFRVGRFETRLGWRVPWARERRHVARMLDSFGLEVSPDALVAELPPVDRALLAILRAVDQVRVAGQGVLVLDEPTAFLPADGTQRLFRTVRDVVAQGLGVLFTTHRLEEVREVGDRISVLRNGDLVAMRQVAGLDERTLIGDILGFNLERLYPESKGTVGSESRFDVSCVTGNVVRELSFEVKSGAVIGLTGLMGMGWEEVPYLLFGAARARSGVVSIEGHAHDLRDFSPQKAVRHGLALLPADRRAASGVGVASLSENMTLASLGTYFRKGRLAHRRERASVLEMINAFEVQPGLPDLPLAALSGGNQQKALIGKWLTTDPRVLLMHEPTQGVDIGSKKRIFEMIRAQAMRGCAVIICSAEHEDLAHLCQRVLVFRGGRVTAELSGDALTYERIAEQCFRSDAPGVDSKPAHLGAVERGCSGPS